MTLPFLRNPEAQKLIWILLPLFAFIYYGGVLGLGFQSDDWYLVGPGAAADLLRNPLGIFSGHYVYSHHYQPFVILYYGVISVLFQDHALLYHLLNLLLFACVLVLYDVLLGRLGVPWPARVAGAVFFGFFWIQLNIIHWVATSSYLLLTILLFLALILWNRYLRDGNLRDLLTTGILAILGSWTHSQGMTVPLILLSWCILLPGGGERRWRRAAPFLISLALLLILVQALPLHFLSQGKVLSKLDTDVFMIMRKISGAVQGGIWPSLVGPAAFGLGETDFPALAGLRSFLVPGLLSLFAANWIFRRTHWRLLVLGLLLALITWIPAAISDKTLTAYFLEVRRFYWFPVLGLSLSVSALVSPLGGIGGIRVKAASIAGIALFLAVFLVNNHDLNGFYWRDITAQHRFLASSAANFRRNMTRVLKGEAGDYPSITIMDVSLNDSRSPGMNYGAALYNATHANFYRFYRLGRETPEVKFLPYDPNGPFPDGGCVFIAVNGQLTRLHDPGNR